MTRIGRLKSNRQMSSILQLLAYSFQCEGGGEGGVEMEEEVKVEEEGEEVKEGERET